ncbi:hypothetical protein FQN50_001496 [Emmonsiellopsis sp. PD_5]|nr:hypothetical protein FQN50_001496 [Emmonsiellopsis sp. PD_5]
MGQSQSSNAKGDDSAEHHEKKTDYYELLGLERTATDEEIKKAYKKKALEHHPDRNYGNVEASTAIFAEIQAAYEVLSDPQERAWYDSHRDGILHGHDSAESAQYANNVKMTTAEDLTGLIMKFNPRMEFSDGPSGFFGGLRETFDKLAREEELTCQWDGLDPVDYPSFGHRDDDYDTIRSFYAIWSGFATKKSFSWKDIHRYSEAPDRRVRRLMEKENKRLRDEAIREFNDSVRSLVAFVKKRDPRYKASVQSEAERQKSLRDAAAAQAARSRAANEAKIRGHQVPEWAMTEEIEEEMFSSESEPEQDYFECVVCGKDFKSEKQFEAHERSKKHIKAVKQLQREMRAEDKHIQQLRTDTGNDSTPSPRDESPPSPITVISENDQPSSQKLDGEEAPSHLAEQASRDSSDSHSLAPSDASEGEPQDLHDADDAGDSDEDYAPREMVEERIAKDARHEDEDTANGIVDDLKEAFSKTSVAAENSDTAQPKVGKAKQKRAKRAAIAAAEEQNGAKSFICAACHTSFPSNSKLFSHIKALNHAQPVPKSKSVKSAKKGGKR